MVSEVPYPWILGEEDECMAPQIFLAGWVLSKIQGTRFWYLWKLLWFFFFPVLWAIDVSTNVFISVATCFVGFAWEQNARHWFIAMGYTFMSFVELSLLVIWVLLLPVFFLTPLWGTRAWLSMLSIQLHDSDFKTAGEAYRLSTPKRLAVGAVVPIAMALVLIVPTWTHVLADDTATYMGMRKDMCTVVSFNATGNCAVSDEAVMRMFRVKLQLRVPLESGDSFVRAYTGRVCRRGGCDPSDSDEELQPDRDDIDWCYGQNFDVGEQAECWYHEDLDRLYLRRKRKMWIAYYQQRMTFVFVFGLGSAIGGLVFLAALFARVTGRWKDDGPGEPPALPRDLEMGQIAAAEYTDTDTHSDTDTDTDTAHPRRRRRRRHITAAPSTDSSDGEPEAGLPRDLPSADAIALPPAVAELAEHMQRGETLLSEERIRELLGDETGRRRSSSAASTPTVEPLPAGSDDDVRDLALEPSVRWFRRQVTRFRRHAGGESNVLNVSRATLLEDTFHGFSRLSTRELRRPLAISFVGERGIDCGGLRREWLQLVCDLAFHPDRGYFEFAAVDNWTYQPTPLSKLHDDWRDYYRFCGRLVAKAAWEGFAMPVHFTRSFYKCMLGLNDMLLEDLQDVAPTLHRSLTHMLENQVEGVFFETFAVEVNELDERKTIELKPGGADIEVTDENKAEYVQLRVSFELRDRIKDQISAFLSGFQELISVPMLKVFTPGQLELMLCGVPEIDVDDWSDHTRYSNCSDSTKVVMFFWRYARESTPERRANILQFCTGCALVPVGGFASLQGSGGARQLFNIETTRQRGLPRSHTCFNTLVLSSHYKRFEELATDFDVALRHGIVGFGAA